MEPSLWSGRRIAGYAGIGFVAVFIAVIVIGSNAPTFDDPPADVREFFVESDTRVHLTTWLGALGFVFFFLPFAAGLRNLLAPSDQADGEMWARLSYTGAVVAVAIGGAGSAFWEVLSQGIAEDLSDGALLALARFDTVIFIAVMPWALALFLAAASVVILRSGVLPRWIGLLSSVGALLLAIGTLWIFQEDDESALGIIGFISLLIFMLWVLVVAITMIRSEQSASAGNA